MKLSFNKQPVQNINQLNLFKDDFNYLRFEVGDPVWFYDDFFIKTFAVLANLLPDFKVIVDVGADGYVELSYNELHKAKLFPVYDDLSNIEENDLVYIIAPQRIATVQGFNDYGTGIITDLGTYSPKQLMIF